MKKIAALTIALVIGMALGATAAARLAVKTYQVTGPVLEVRPDAVVVQKGTEKWEIARDASTKVTGDLKVDSKATIQYRMTATDIAVAAEKAKAPAAKKGK
jgi:hypothetical protein